MASCFENVQLPPCVWFEGGEKRNALASIVAGIMFFTGWWFIIDVAVTYPDMTTFNHAYHTCGVIGTISLFMINAVSNSQMNGDGYSNGCFGPRGARTWLFFGFVLGFAAVIAACWILFADFVGKSDKPHWPGVGLFLQNTFIFIGSLVYKFGRSEELWG